MNRLVMNFLVTEGYVDAAEKFRMESGTERILLASPNSFPVFWMFLNVFVDGRITCNYGSFHIHATPYRCKADIDLATITDRMAVKKAVQSGNVEDAIEKVNDLNPEVK